MSYVLGTTENVVRYYKFEVASTTKPGQFALQMELDLTKIPVFADKNSAKEAAIALGLKTWRYVRLP